MTTAIDSNITQSASVHPGELSRALANALLVLSHEGLPILRTAHLRFTDGQVRVVATDRYRLVRQFADATTTTAWSVLIGHRDISAIRTLIALDARCNRDKREHSVTLTRDEQGLHVVCGLFTSTFEPVIGAYPDVDPILAEEELVPTERVTFTRQFLADLGRLSPGDDPSITISFRGANRAIRAEVGDDLTYVLMTRRA